MPKTRENSIKYAFNEIVLSQCPCSEEMKTLFIDESEFFTKREPLNKQIAVYKFLILIPCTKDLFFIINSTQNNYNALHALSLLHYSGKGLLRKATIWFEIEKVTPCTATKFNQSNTHTHLAWKQKEIQEKVPCWKERRPGLERQLLYCQL